MNNIKSKKEQIIIEIDEESKERSILISSYEKIKQEISKVDRKLEDYYRNKQELERIISNTQNAFDKILDNTKTLHSLIKKDEKVLLTKKDNSEKLF